MKKKKKHGSKAKKGHAHGAHGRSGEWTLARLIAEAKVPERIPLVPPEPLKPLEARVLTPPEPEILASARVPLLEALASPLEPEPEAPVRTGSGRTMRRSAVAVMALVAAAACVFGVARKCAAPEGGSEAIDSSAIEAGPEPAVEEAAALVA